MTNDAPKHEGRFNKADRFSIYQNTTTLTLMAGSRASSGNNLVESA
jgi:hypothetical protein